MTKLIVTDMDGTLTYDSKTKNTYSAEHNAVPELNRKAVEKILANDCLFAVATGRLNRDVKMNLGEELSKESYILTQNGSFIFDPNGQLLDSTTYSTELFTTVVSQMLENDFAFCFSNSISHYYNDYLGQETMDRIFGPNTPKIPYDGQLNHEGVANVCVVGKDKEETQAAYQKLTALLDDELVNYQITGPNTIDINPKAVSKGNGIQKLAQRLGLEEQNIHVVGDSYNDLSMFKSFENSYCMSHSNPDLRAQAKHTIEMFCEILNYLK